MTQKVLSNPFSTGSGGSSFETRVQTAFLINMLSGGGLPSLKGHLAYKIKLQGKYAGYNTDDFIVYARNAKTGVESKLLAQIKHRISFTEDNEVFSEVINAAFEDFNSKEFDIDTDKIAIISGPISAIDIDNTRVILDWARYCENEKEFFFKIDSKKFSSNAKRSKVNAFRAQLGKSNEGNISDEKLWKFLKVYHIFSYDFDVDSGIDLSLVSSILSQYTSDPISLFNNISEYIRNANQYAGTITFDNIPGEIACLFTKNINPPPINISPLEEHSRYIFETIKTDINGVMIRREEYLSQLAEEVIKNKFVLVSGARGTGKSGLVKSFIEMHTDILCFYFRTEDFDHSHLDKMLHTIGISSGLSSLEHQLSLTPSKIIVLESLEKLLELQHVQAFRDLITFLKRTKGWTVIATARDYAVPQLMMNYFSEMDFLCQQFTVGDFTGDEVDSLCAKIPELSEIKNGTYLKGLLANPFLADFLYRVSTSPYKLSPTSTVDDFKNAVWEYIIAKSDERRDGLPLKRRHGFVQLAVSRAKSMTYWVPVWGIDPEAVLNLQRDGLIALSQGHDKVALSHDMLEDWALESYIQEAYSQHNNISEFFSAIGSEQAICRAFRIWLLSKMLNGNYDQDFLKTVLSADIPQYWRDEVIAAILQSDHLPNILSNISELLLADDCNILKQLCFILRVVCQHPISFAEAFGINEDKRTIDDLKFYELRPNEKNWIYLIDFISNNFESIIESMENDILALIKEWNKVYSKYLKSGHNYIQPGLLSIKLLERNASSYSRSDELGPPLETLAYSVCCIKDDVNAFLDKHIYCSKKRRDRARFADTLRGIFLESLVASSAVCRNAPGITQKLALHEWLLDTQHSDRSYSSTDIHKYFGLERHYPDGFSPESGAKGFFSTFFQIHPWKALDFSIKLLNYAAEKYSTSSLDKRESDSFWGRDMSLYEERLYFPDGTSKLIICSERLWLAYRGSSVFPDLLQCLLMAIENWLINLMESEIDDNIVKKIFELIIKNSNSCCVLSVLASIASGFPEKCAKHILPILSVKKLYKFDISRVVQESSVKMFNWFGMSHDPYAKIYAEERKISAERPWRNKDLRDLAITIYIQMNPERPYFINVLKDEYKSSEDVDLGLLINQIDIENWKGEIKDDKVLFSPPDITDANIKEKVDIAEKEYEHVRRFSSLMLWAENHIRKDRQSQVQTSWEEALKLAQELKTKIENGDDPLRRPYVTKSAAVLLKEYNTVLSNEERRWCLEIVAEAIATTCDVLDLDHGERIDPVDQYGIGICASAIPFLYRLDEDIEYRDDIKSLILLAITHRSKLVRVEVAKSIATLWESEPVLAKWCAWCAIEYAQFIKQEDVSIYFQLRSQDTYQSAVETILRLRDELRDRLFENEPPDGLLELSFERLSASHSLEVCLMLPTSTVWEQHFSFARNFIEHFCLSEPHRYSQGRERENYFSYEAHVPFAEWLGELCFNHTDRVIHEIGVDLKKACELAPSFTHFLFLQILIHGEKINDFNCYKRYFEYLMTTLVKLSIKYCDDSKHDHHGDTRALLRMFINASTPWIKNLEEQNSILDAKELIIRFSRDAACNKEVFLGLSSLVYKFPEVFLNEALGTLARNVESNRRVMDSNAAFYCETFIHKYLLNSHGPLPRVMHRNLNIILDALVERGSAKAYFLREHLVRSRKIEN